MPMGNQVVWNQTTWQFIFFSVHNVYPKFSIANLKLFKNDNLLAVRIPKEFGLQGWEVYTERQSDTIINI